MFGSCLLLVLICCARLSLAAFGGHDLFTSLGQLNELWKNEKDVVRDMKDTIKRMEEIKDTFEKYIKSHEDTQLDQEPNFDYLGNPLNGYFLIRHVAFGWGEVRTKVFEAENATRAVFGKRRQIGSRNVHHIRRKAKGGGTRNSLYLVQFHFTVL